MNKATTGMPEAKNSNTCSAEPQLFKISTILLPRIYLHFMQPVVYPPRNTDTSYKYGCLIIRPYTGYLGFLLQFQIVYCTYVASTWQNQSNQ